MHRHRVYAPVAGAAADVIGNEAVKVVNDIADGSFNPYAWFNSAKAYLGVGAAAAIVDKVQELTASNAVSDDRYLESESKPWETEQNKLFDQFAERVMRDIRNGVVHSEPVIDSSPSHVIPTEDISLFPDRSSSRMSYKRSRVMSAPVATTSSVNFLTANRSVAFSGREFYQDVKVAATTAGSTYKTESQLLRPTDSHLFSWLAGIARKFEEFKFTRLRFIYEPQCSTATAGSIALYYDGDPTHIAPGTWNTLINTGANTHGAPWAKHVLDVPPQLFASRKSYYTFAEFADLNASGAAINPTDPLEYFPGIFGIASEGVTSTASQTISVGKVYLEYSIALRTQNTEGYNVTSLTNTVRSGEIADNSGIGMYHKLTSFPLANGFIFGGLPRVSEVFAGNEYFKVNESNGVWTAVQNLNLLFIMRCTSGAAIDVTTFGADLDWGLTLPGSTVALTAKADLDPYIILQPDSSPNGNDVTVIYSMNIPVNSQLYLKTTEVLTFCQMYWAPFAFQMVLDKNA